MNLALRYAINDAKAVSMPKDNIERAIKRASGDADGAILKEMLFEGYGPGGGAILVQALSDNRNRTLQGVRHLFSRGGGNLGEAGCVGWLFESRGVITVRTESLDTEELALKAIDAGADDVTVETGFIEIYTRPEELEAVREALEQEEIPIASVEVSMVPKVTIQLDDKAAFQTLRLMEKLDEVDDVRYVASNVDFSDEITEKYQEQS